MKDKRLEDVAGLVGGGIGIKGGEVLDGSGKGVDLRSCGTGVIATLLGDGFELRGGKAEAIVRGEALEQVVDSDLAAAKIADGGDGVLLDGFVGGFASGTIFDGLH